MQILNPLQFLSESLNGIIIDVRSPSEFALGHIPKSVSLPMFSDEERKIVGTLYKQIGKQDAILAGLEIIGKKMKHIAENAIKISGGKALFVYCWRGGMRSKSMIQLFEIMGIECFVLQGGYKAYRNLIIEEFKLPWKFVVLGGMTGSGKTEIINELALKGEQTINLEKLANHKGSAFGSIGEMPQPSTEQFANNLYLNLSKLNKQKRIWIEDESQKIGTVVIPYEFYSNYRKANIIVLNIPFERRLNNLVKVYGKYDKMEIVESFKKINKKLGGQHVQAAIEFVANDKLKDAAALALKYYDKTYKYGLQNKNTDQIFETSFEEESISDITQKLIETANEKIS
ncbi:MAG: tRNA 2-selenouridine(34) synthase MnmH [Bacteroidia bacterium]|nr:tRNA 2-selenouridine(34) synthase MnmH [Bacteroidia bacterium]